MFLLVEIEFGNFLVSESEDCVCDLKINQPVGAYMPPLNILLVSYWTFSYLIGYFVKNLILVVSCDIISSEKVNVKNKEV